jgi:hypothetical protein
MKTTKGTKDLKIATVLFLVAAAALIVGGVFLFPAGSTTCFGGPSCVSTFSPFHGASMIVGTVFAVLGLAFVYRGLRIKFPPMYP